MPELADDEDTRPDTGRGGPPDVSPTKKRSFAFLDSEDYKGAKSALVERKFLQEHVDRLEEQVAELKPYREAYHSAKTRLDVLTERRGLTRLAAGVASVLL